MLWIVGITVLATSLVLVLLQNFKTPEQVVERKVEHRHAVCDPQFRREMSVLLGPAIVQGNQVTALQNGNEIFPAMLPAIRSAQRSITFETFIYWSGEIAEEFSQALSERARTGVPVSVIIDWVGSNKMDQSLLDAMEAAGVRLHRYRPLHWYNFGRMNNRTHRKLLVVDGRIGFTGGVGIADQWTGDGGDPEHWRDTHFRIEGPVVAQLQAAFNNNWIKTTGQVLNGPSYFPALEEEGGMDAHMFVASPSGGSESMHLMYLLAIAAAEATIDLAASYFVPDTLLIQALIAARGRGVRVRILLPGPYLDAITVRIASRADWGVLLHAGAEIHVYQPTMLHTKLLVIDAEFVSVGSTNFDMRSIRLNDEASLNVYSSDFATQMTTIFEKDLLAAEPYSLARWKSRPFREKFSEKILLPIRSQL
ncbi:phospholipase D-like domain-containing protein [Ectothiorhodospira lacustris]|uniref:phospholipase D-like domain-containing protein n=1 Tax=Ectothiorhodospira lacustris TaxID=2899127 RepID=UPI001EE88565|nr:phospholipase D-like domain-containing protein [Ectothiorhodospira lacustris]MCG5508823.1 phospholipase D-like domain-containing protein [Ectothiorhodospira lacustris]MCG5520614.1 phospholipase D-like domain-containing protein [Ectothiorhodospira lacustris]